MRTVSAAVERLNEVFDRNVVDGCPPESCDEINDASYDVMAAMRNQYKRIYFLDLEAPSEDLILSKTSSGHVILPCIDEEIKQMVLKRKNAKNCQEDLAIIEAIYARAKKLGGQILIFT